MNLSDLNTLNSRSSIVLLCLTMKQTLYAKFKVDSLSLELFIVTELQSRKLKCKEQENVLHNTYGGIYFLKNPQFKSDKFVKFLNGANQETDDLQCLTLSGGRDRSDRFNSTNQTVSIHFKFVRLFIFFYI